VKRQRRLGAQEFAQAAMSAQLPNLFSCGLLALSPEGEQHRNANAKTSAACEQLQNIHRVKCLKARSSRQRE